MAKEEGTYEMLIGSGVLILSNSLPGALPHARGEKWTEVTQPSEMGVTRRRKEILKLVESQVFRFSTVGRLYHAHLASSLRLPRVIWVAGA